MEQALAKKGQQDIVREGYFDLSPRSLGEAIQLAELMAKSDLIPAQFRNKPGDVLIAVQYGAEVGLKPLQAMQGICVINGRPTIWGDAALAVVLASGLMADYKEMTTEEIEKAGKAVFWCVRKGTPEPIVREFSIDDAKKAHLWGNPKKPIWFEYPWRMLQMRARSWALRDGFSDALKGMSTREEVEDYSVPEAPKVLAMPKRMSERQLEPSHEEKPEPEIPRPSPCESCNQALLFHEAGQSGELKWDAYWACPQFKKGNGHSAIPDAAFQESLKAQSREPGQEG